MTFETLRLPRLARPQPAPAHRAADRAVPTTSGKWIAGAFSAIVLLVAASPVVENWKASPRDDFPLSYFRMFSENRADIQHLNYLVGLDAGGDRFLIPYKYAGPGGMNQVRQQMNKLVADGHASRLCESVAKRVEKAGSRLSPLQTIEVTTGTFHLSTYFTGQRTPAEENIRATCSVERARS